jgi:hypothetical protein
VNKDNIPQLDRLGQAPKWQAQLGNPGLACLRRGTWWMVMALTKILWREGLSHG